VDLTGVSDVSLTAMFFGETQGRYVVSSFSPEIVERIMSKHGVAVSRIGYVTDTDAGFSIRYGDVTLAADVDTLSSAWHDSIPHLMSAPATPAGVETAMMAG
jgi:hypothetical protein